MVLSEAARVYATTTQQLLADAKAGKATVRQVSGVFWLDTSGGTKPDEVSSTPAAPQKTQHRKAVSPLSDEAHGHDHVPRDANL